MCCCGSGNVRRLLRGMFEVEGVGNGTCGSRAQRFCRHGSAGGRGCGPARFRPFPQGVWKTSALWHGIIGTFPLKHRNFLAESAALFHTAFPCGFMEGSGHRCKGIRTLFRNVRKSFSKSFILFRGRSGKPSRNRLCLFADGPEILLEIVYAFSRNVRKVPVRSYAPFGGRLSPFCRFSAYTMSPSSFFILTSS